MTADLVEQARALELWADTYGREPEPDQRRTTLAEADTGMIQARRGARPSAALVAEVDARQRRERIGLAMIELHKECYVRLSDGSMWPPHAPDRHYRDAVRVEAALFPKGAI